MDAAEPVEDTTLAQRLRTGDADAFTTIYSRYHDVIYLYALRLSGDEDTAADIVQDIFLSLWERRAELPEALAFRPYLFRAARFKYLNAAQHEQVRQRAAGHFQAYLDAGSHAVDDHIEEQELFERLRVLVDRLPGKMTQVFRLRQDNHSDRDIARQLQISEKTVKNLMSEAVKRLEGHFRRFLLPTFRLFFLKMGSS